MAKPVIGKRDKYAEGAKTSKYNALVVLIYENATMYQANSPRMFHLGWDAQHVNVIGSQVVVTFVHPDAEEFRVESSTFI